jgi:copper chaperone
MCLQTGPDQSKKIVKEPPMIDEKSEIIKLRVEGMNCNHCVQAVTKVLLSVPGVISADVSLQDSSAVVHGNHLHPPELIRVIEDVGFSAEMV